MAVRLDSFFPAKAGEAVCESQLVTHDKSHET